MLTCPVCLELGREPQTLTQCMHNICQQCLQRLLRENSTGVQCPICRKFSAKHEIRNNFILKDMLRCVLNHMHSSSFSYIVVVGYQRFDSANKLNSPNKSVIKLLLHPIVCACTRKCAANIAGNYERSLVMG